jgi:hypothetical protein
MSCLLVASPTSQMSRPKNYSAFIFIHIFSKKHQLINIHTDGLLVQLERERERERERDTSTEKGERNCGKKVRKRDEKHEEVREREREREGK